MSGITKYVFNFITDAALAVFVMSFLFGWSRFLDQLGGLRSFGGIIALLVMGAVLIGGIIYLQSQHYNGWESRRIRDLVGGAIVALVLGAIGYNWINLPSGAGWKVMLVLIAIAIAAGISTFIGYVEDE